MYKVFAVGGMMGTLAGFGCGEVVRENPELVALHNETVKFCAENLSFECINKLGFTVHETPQGPLVVINQQARIGERAISLALRNTQLKDPIDIDRDRIGWGAKGLLAGIIGVEVGWAAATLVKDAKIKLSSSRPLPR